MHQKWLVPNCHTQTHLPDCLISLAFEILVPSVQNSTHTSIRLDRRREWTQLHDKQLANPKAHFYLKVRSIWNPSQWLLWTNVRRKRALWANHIIKDQFGLNFGQIAVGF